MVDAPAAPCLPETVIAVQTDALHQLPYPEEDQRMSAVVGTRHNQGRQRERAHGYEIDQDGTNAAEESSEVIVIVSGYVTSLVQRVAQSGARYPGWRFACQDERKLE